MIQYRILETGFFVADGGVMFGAVPKRAWKRAYPIDDDGNCRLAMNCLLVWNGKRVVLLDTGVGDKSLGKLSYYNFRNLKDIVELVYSYGFEPEQVTDVVLSHLHFDHCGGCTYVLDNQLNITFPKARHWVSKLQWETFMNPNELELHSYRSQDMMPVFEAGLVRLIDKDVELFDGFNLSLFDGHTKGQIVSFIDLGKKETLLFPGDVIPTKAHLSDSWISAYDIEPLESLAAKKRIKEWTDGENVIHIFYHDAYQTDITFLQ
ncbi:MAG: MBL fold metallo-hydrolase [Dysgonamonadaceae bacterium]|jgi:glyoxylase-like metal-dependent hydrolase (beta-lactamase superfamily II)|nr:MBL fold metallo-hydrolase [Dysgonamonadaceae bacterium]